MSNSRTLLRKMKTEGSRERKIGKKGHAFARVLSDRTKIMDGKRFVLHATRGWRPA